MPTPIEFPLVGAGDLEHTDYANYVQNPGFEHEDADNPSWVLGTGQSISSAGPRNGAKHLAIAPGIVDPVLNANLFDCPAGARLYGEAYFMAAGSENAGVRFSVRMEFLDAAGASLGFSDVAVTSAVTPPTSYTKASGFVTAPADSAYGRFVVGWWSGSNDATWYVDDCFCTRAVPSAMIDDATLRALAALDSAVGVVEQTGVDTFTKTAATDAATASTVVKRDSAGAASLSRQTLSGGAAGTKTLTVKGNASDNANLQEWQENDGTVLAFVSQTGVAVFGQYTPALTARDVATFFINNTSDSGIVRFYNGGAGQGMQGRFVAGAGGTSQVMFSDAATWISAIAVTAADGMEFRLRSAADANSEAGLNAAKRFRINYDGTVGVEGSGAAVVKFYVKGHASQSAALQEWRNSADSPLASIDAAGRLRFNTAASGSTNEGSVWSDSTQKALQTFVDGIEQTLSGVVFTATADKTVANTAAETSILGTGVGTKTLPANFFAAGKTVRVRVRGRLSTTGTPTLNIQAKLGSTVIAQTTAIALSGTVANNYFEAEIEIVCRTTGASGTVAGAGKFSYDNTTQTGKVEGMVNTGTVTVDTTASQVLDVTATWGAASASNTMTGQTVTVEVLN